LRGSGKWKYAEKHHRILVHRCIEDGYEAFRQRTKMEAHFFACDEEDAGIYIK
jgi:hypothetical protein